VNVLGLQFNIAWENKPANFATVRRLLQAARPEPGTLVLLPEMFATGFSMNAEGISESYGGPTETFLADTAREYSIWLLGGAAMRSRDGHCRNKALLFSPAGKLEGFYAKMRPFSPGEEARHYIAGTQPSIFNCGEVTLCPFVCYDLRFPELFRAAAAARRPQLYVVIASWPEKRIAHWTRLLQARAIENQAYVAGVNRIGSDPFYRYNGHSVIIDPQGEIIADAGETEGSVSAGLNLADLAKYRAGLPFLDDLRKAQPSSDIPSASP